MMDIKEDGYQNMMDILLLWFINFLIKSPQEVVLLIIAIIITIIIMILSKTCNYLKNYTNQLLENLKKIKIYSGLKDNIWGADLADMQLIRKFNKGFRFLLCVINIFSKYAWVAPLKDKKRISVVNYFQKILNWKNIEFNGIAF